MRLAERMDLARHATDRMLVERLATPAGVPGRLSQAMFHAVMAGGKRFRPFLVLECAGLFGITSPAALPTAAALECVHAYSLAHDDLPAMDNDRLRRGEPTVWARFDEWTAILAGDALLTLAFEILSEPATHADPAVRTVLIGELAKASGGAGMVGGQALDLAAEKLRNPLRPGFGYVYGLQSMKTGALIRFACESGAILASAPQAQRQALTAYGRALGLAFQLSDDLLDAEGDAAVVGKATGKDAAAGKPSMVATIGVEATRRELTKAIAEARTALVPFGQAAAVLIAAAEMMAERRT